MRTYIIRRMLLFIPTLIFITLIIFCLVRFIPGNVIDLMVAEMGSEAGMSNIELTTEYVKHRLGMDVPIYVQYGRWLGVLPRQLPFSDKPVYNGMLQGSLGESLWRNTPVTDELRQRIPVSVELGFLGLMTALCLALPIGIYSAIRQDTTGDYIGRTVAILCISLPSFWLGTMVMVFPSIWWGWSPNVQYIPITKDLPGNLQQFMIAALIYGMVLSGTAMRMTRTMMLEVLRQDYIRTAWAKGLTERTVIIRHALKNALIPVVTIVGMQIPIMIGGTVVLEQIFCLPGMGMLLIEAMGKRDYPIISGINVVLGSFILVLNLLVDLTYGWLDPRVRYQ